MKNEVKCEVAKITAIKNALLEANNIVDALNVVARFQGSIHSIHHIKNGRRMLVSGEIHFARLSDYEENMGSIIYRSKGSIFFTGDSKEIPSFRLPQDSIELIMGVF